MFYSIFILLLFYFTGHVLQVSLVLNSTFHAKNRRRNYTQVVTKKSDTTEVEPGETRSWTSVRISVPPYIPESRLDGCDMIDIAYELQVYTETTNLYLPLYHLIKANVTRVYVYFRVQYLKQFLFLLQ